MWICGDWGQASPWSRDTGVMMVKGNGDVYTGELSLPMGTKFDLKILKSTVSTTSGGDNTWSAVRYASTLNKSTSYDFGEFADNLIPSASIKHGKWTPAECMSDPTAFGGKDVLAVGGNHPASCTSDVFVLPPNQTLRLTGYIRTTTNGVEGTVTMKVVTPQQQTLFELSESSLNGWSQFSRTFKTDDVQRKCQIVLSNETTGDNSWRYGAYFQSLSLVSP